MARQPFNPQGLAAAATPEGELRRRMVLWLFDQYGGRRGVPTWRGDRALETATIERGCNISAATWGNIRNGRVAAFASETKVKLAEVFRPAVPGFDPDWFDLEEFEKFRDIVEGAGDEYYIIQLPVPVSSPGRVNMYKDWLPGVYISYRYSFEINSDDSVAREVLRIWRDAVDGQYKFHLWYVVGGARPGEPVEVFEGSVVPIGDMIMMVGVSKNRARCIFWSFDHHHYDKGDRFCRFGITTSAKARDDRAPVTACTIFLKVPTVEDDWQWWCSEKSRIIGVLPLSDLLKTDFPGKAPDASAYQGKAIGEWITTFIENEPMDASETTGGVADRILRLNLTKYRLRMEGIRQQLLADEAVRAPFKKDWRTLHQEPVARDHVTAPTGDSAIRG